ncbi:MAG: hypothetical protein JNL62_18590, partial [Bryobacterales bacterium]|nr:hypothetical protein [Bryobacterales bacterium]
MMLSEDLHLWAQQALESRGALVEASDDGSLRAMLPATLAEALHSSEWLQLRFGAGAGADDPVEWLDRLAVLLPASPRLIAARPRHSTPARRIDAQAVLAKEFVLQNGVCRCIEDYADTGLYFFFSFAYEVESNERMQGLITVALNGTAQSTVSLPGRMLAEPR